ncbi:hypothetical protein C8C83_0675 [Flavobacterium sp. 90]|uniref:DUF6252 family protein n=1 Tax=unclassified Flavobacterium TaxID=196869 RepID=UPI000EB3B164|nr:MULTISPECIES: DUF6252 family protein [unclassified Flavobacterium]RKR09075.1 hypothetical protein C8C82_0973 [Flavobacterium sp. 81]TCK52859.1 hypothetical protein C8C83_0675 [Flavobacterium sp. 90]
MKKIYVLFVSILTVGFFFNSCSSDESVDDEVVVDTAAGKLQFDFDGQTFVSTSVQAIIEDDYISIMGLRSSKGDFIVITVPSNKVGTYTWKNVSNQNKGWDLRLAYSASSTDDSSFIGLSKEDANNELGISDYEDTATVTITSIDSKTKKLSGTFQFTGIRSNSNNKLENKTFTKGSFNEIAYTSNVPVVNKNTFSAKLDGTNFVPTSVTAISVMGKIMIGGIKGSVENILVAIPSTIKKGTYSVGSGFDYVLTYSKDATLGNMFDASKGTIVILSHDTAKKTISGTFTASLVTYPATVKHEITEGAFNISY